MLYIPSKFIRGASTFLVTALAFLIVLGREKQIDPDQAQEFLSKITYAMENHE